MSLSGCRHFQAEWGWAGTPVDLMCVLPRLALCWAGWWAFLSLVPPSPADESGLVDRGSDVALVRGQRPLGDKDRENGCWCSLAFGD